MRDCERDEDGNNGGETINFISSTNIYYRMPDIERMACGWRASLPEE